MTSVGPETIPTNPAEILLAAQALDLPIADTCMPGVFANLALLHSHAEVLLGHKRPPAR